MVSDLSVTLISDDELKALIRKVLRQPGQRGLCVGEIAEAVEQEGYRARKPKYGTRVLLGSVVLDVHDVLLEWLRESNSRVELSSHRYTWRRRDRPRASSEAGNGNG